MHGLFVNLNGLKLDYDWVRVSYFLFIFLKKTSLCVCKCCGKLKYAI